MLSAMNAARADSIANEVCGRELAVSNPSKLFFPEPGLTKLDLVEYYLACEEAVERHLRPAVPALTPADDDRPLGPPAR
jgi:hypothetical protein